MQFEGLPEVDWAGIRHAHGAATDVPDMLERLCSADPAVRGEACGELFETVWHQGTIYSASAEILPFLFQIVAQRNKFSPGEVDGQSIPSSDEIAVGLICSIATGETWLRDAVRIDGLEVVQARLEQQGRSLPEEQELERQTLERIKEFLLGNAGSLEAYRTTPEGLGEIVEEALERIESQMRSRP
ncbi:MAG: hypothetical protein WCK51_10310 [Armatimonadota bacterium]